MEGGGEERRGHRAWARAAARARSSVPYAKASLNLGGGLRSVRAGGGTGTVSGRTFGVMYSSTLCIRSGPLCFFPAAGMQVEGRKKIKSNKKGRLDGYRSARMWLRTSTLVVGLQPPGLAKPGNGSLGDSAVEVAPEPSADPTDGCEAAKAGRAAQAAQAAQSTGWRGLDWTFD